MTTIDNLSIFLDQIFKLIEDVLLDLATISELISVLFV